MDQEIIISDNHDQSSENDEEYEEEEDESDIDEEEDILNKNGNMSPEKAKKAVLMQINENDNQESRYKRDLSNKKLSSKFNKEFMGKQAISELGLVNSGAKQNLLQKKGGEEMFKGKSRIEFFKT